MADPATHGARANTMADCDKYLAFVDNTPARNAKPGAPKTAGISLVCRSDKR